MMMKKVQILLGVFFIDLSNQKMAIHHPQAIIIILLKF